MESDPPRFDFGREVESMPWNQAILVARANRADACVAQQVWRAGTRSPVPDDVRTEWKTLQAHRVFYAEASLRELQRIGAGFHARGIAALLYKGIDFQLRCYDPTAPRGFSDTDLVVLPDLVDVAAGALQDLGYRLASGSRPIEVLQRYHLHAVFQHPDHPRAVELHWALDGRGQRAVDPVPGLISRATASDELGPGLLRPESIDALLLMAIHLDKHLGSVVGLPLSEARLRAVIEMGGLIWVEDVARWFERWGTDRAETAIECRVEEMAAMHSMCVALRLAVDLRPRSIPAWAHDWVLKSPARGSLRSRLLFPDLHRGRVTPSALRRRQALSTIHPQLGFRPLRVLEALTPRVRLDGPAGRSPRPRWIDRWRGIAAGVTAALGTRGVRRIRDPSTGEVRRRGTEE